MIRVAITIASLVMAALLSGCSSHSNRIDSSVALYSIGAPIPKGGGKRFVGRPHFTNGRWYHPAADPDYDQIGLASWYGRDFRGRTTANGERFDPDRLTTAHPTLPLPSYLEVTNLENGRVLLLRANDRGPFLEGRLVDISERAAHLLGFHKAGLVKARVKYIGPAPLSGDDALEERVASDLERRLSRAR